MFKLFKVNHAKCSIQCKSSVWFTIQILSHSLNDIIKALGWHLVIIVFRHVRPARPVFFVCLNLVDQFDCHHEVCPRLVVGRNPYTLHDATALLIILLVECGHLIHGVIRTRLAHPPTVLDIVFQRRQIFTRRDITHSSPRKHSYNIDNNRPRTSGRQKLKTVVV